MGRAKEQESAGTCANARASCDLWERLFGHVFASSRLTMTLGLEQYVVALDSGGATQASS